MLRLYRCCVISTLLYGPEVGEHRQAQDRFALSLLHAYIWSFAYSGAIGLQTSICWSGAIKKTCLAQLLRGVGDGLGIYMNWEDNLNWFVEQHSFGSQMVKEGINDWQWMEKNDREYVKWSEPVICFCFVFLSIIFQSCVILKQSYNFYFLILPVCSNEGLYNSQWWRSLFNASQAGQGGARGDSRPVPVLHAEAQCQTQASSSDETRHDYFH